VTAHIRSIGPDGFRCTVYDVGTLREREAFLPRSNAYSLREGVAPPELKPGDTLIALVAEVSAAGPAGGELLVLSATAPELVERILSGFVDEILTGKVVIKNVARVAGSKSKIAVAPTTKGVNARGACIGRGASRLKDAEALLNRAYGRERLEIIEYSSDRAVFLANAMSPIQVSDVLVEGNKAVVAVKEHQLSGGIGAGGLNAELAGRLAGLYVQIVKEGTDLRAAMDKPFSQQPAASSS
jgi:transcription antitermination factor NusA-like protein